MKSYYIITQNIDYFRERDFKSLSIRKPFFKNNFMKSGVGDSVEIFILDHHSKKLFGIYKIDTREKEERDNFYVLKVVSSNYRRGIYFDLEYRKYKDFDVIKIEEHEYKKLERKLDVLNNQMRQTFFAYSLKNNIFKYQIVETNKSLYVAEYEKQFDKIAFDNIYSKYKELISIASSENSEKYETLGEALMNMLIPEDDVRDFLLSSNRIVYLSNSNNKNKINIPFEILNHKKSFLAKDIIFSYTHAKNMLRISEKKKKDKLSVALILIPNDDLIHAQRESDFIIKNESSYCSIDRFNKNITYLEFINILENYDIIHIITHGKNRGIMLSENYLLKHIPLLTNPPILLFMNVCNGGHEENELVSSMIRSGITTVVSGNGAINDLSYIDFVNSFYSNLLNKESRLNTAEAYYFALIENMENSNIFLRYRFSGIASYVY